jgi:hypothetical protein
MNAERDVIEQGRRERVVQREALGSHRRETARG